jgi:RHS repeat-associated protein
VKYNFNAGANTQDRLVSYNYDAVGNRTSVTDNGSPSTYNVNNINQYATVNGNSLSYDANGNLVAAPVLGAAWTYVYDAQNRLASASSVSSVVNSSYDARNRCVTRTINGVTTFFCYDGWNLIEERDVSDTQLARYVHGANTDELLARITPTTLSYYHYDALGSVIALTDANGNVTERYCYDVFGTPAYRDINGTLVSSSSSGNRFLFTGREYLNNANLYDYRNRTYSPALGRFLQADGLRFDARDANLYRYVGNSPTNRIDPTGNDWLTFILKRLASWLAGKTGGENELGGPVVDGDATWQLVDQSDICEDGKCLRNCEYELALPHRQDELPSTQYANQHVSCDEDCPSSPNSNFGSSDWQPANFWR